jgi:hypothetical protein
MTHFFPNNWAGGGSAGQSLEHTLGPLAGACALDAGDAIKKLACGAGKDYSEALLGVETRLSEMAKGLEQSGVSCQALIRTLYMAAEAFIEARHSGKIAAAERGCLVLQDLESSLYDIWERRTHPERGTARIRFLADCLARYGYTRYLEIGCNDDCCFNEIAAAHKVGVDPERGGTLRMTSDEFFSSNRDSFDLVFIDGLHTAGQVRKDIRNALKILAPNGTIAVHDCCPRFEIRQRVPKLTGVWNGDVWKAFLEVRRDRSIDSVVGDFDHGCGVIRARANSQPLEVLPAEPSWGEFVEHRVEWLRLMAHEDVLRWIEEPGAV